MSRKIPSAKYKLIIIVSPVSEWAGLANFPRTVTARSTYVLGGGNLCRDRLGINALSATYVLAEAAKSLKGTIGTVLCG